MEGLDEIQREIKQTGYLNRRYTKKHTMSRQWGYYINLESIESSDIEFAYFKGRVMSDVIEKLGLLEDILEKITITQLMALIKTKEKKNG